jgi:hypothetical protein
MAQMHHEQVLSKHRTPGGVRHLSETERRRPTGFSFPPPNHHHLSFPLRAGCGAFEMGDDALAAASPELQMVGNALAEAAKEALQTPVRVVRTLMQLGWEPHAPTAYTNWFGQPCVQYSGLLSYGLEVLNRLSMFS